MEGSPPKRKRTSPETRRASGRARIAGFDDEEDLPEEDEDRSRTVSQGGSGEDPADVQELDEEHCAICLSPIENKTVVHPCHHGQFCWNCIRAWTDQSRKCPLCLGPIEHLIHNIRSAKDYQIHHLLPLSALASDGPLPPRGNRRSTINPTLPRHALYGRNRFSSASRLNDIDETTWREREEERALERRKYIYKEGLYAKHVASNRYTGFKPFTPQTFANNGDMKARVIKFVRRELQVFPTVDISFLTTYLVSIASQLDLRSAAAIRLISDFLSEQDAQHLVHEITTFARSPFTSLEGYDRFVQYGRPEREKPREQEFEEMVHDPEEMEKQAPRFAEHMQQRKRRESEDGYRRPPPPPPMASLPPRPTDEVRRVSQDEMFRRRDGDRGYGGGPPVRRGRSPSPPPFRRGPPRGGGRYRSPSPQPEPSWRDRDERYTGSYFATSGSRRDYPRGGGGGGRRYSYRSRSRSVSPPRKRRYDSRSPPPHLSRSRRGYSRSRSPSPRRSRSRSHSRSSRPPRSPSPRRSPSPARSYRSSRRDDRSPPPSSRPRGRSRSVTPIRRSSASPTPPPPAHDSGPGDLDYELADAISLGAPSASSNGPTPRLASPAARPASAAGRPIPTGPSKPTLSIFGAARRLLGNGNVVTIGENGRAVRLASASEGAGASAGVQVRGSSSAVKGKGKAVELVREEEQEPYDALPASRPTGAAGKSLLARLGSFAPSPVPSPALSDSSSHSAAPSSAPSAAVGPATQSLREKLQARLTAEYRQALASRANGASPVGAANGSSLPANGGKTDLRALLQSRLEAEKAIASRSSSAAGGSTSVSLAAGGPPVAFNAGAGGERATFSQATRDLLMARLEEERLLALAQASVGSHVRESYGDEWDDDPTPPLATNLSAAAAPFVPSRSSSSSSSAASASPAQASAPAKSESSLKAALLAKRQAVVEDELKKRTGELKEKLMRQKLEKARREREGKKAAEAVTGDGA
ncbi:hypothetical protein JCM6882_002510 [Rhodosporidiobolus microsporus]